MISAVPTDLLAAVPRLAWPCLLGEGVTWHPGSDAWPEAGVFFVDIHGRALHFVQVDGGGHRHWPVPQRLGWLIPSADGATWIAGFQEGVARLRLTSAAAEVVQWLARPFEGRPQMRLNDAKADAAGRVWLGSMDNDDESRPEGALMCLASASGPARVVDPGYRVCNGPALHPDGRLFLHTDSAARTIFAFDLDPATGELSGKRTWKTFVDGEGYPDGMNFDAGGDLWVAHWGAGLVSRYAADGRLVARAALPVRNVTNVCFAGPGLDRLMVTTARVGNDEAALAAQPLAGSLFEIQGHGRTGLAPARAGF